MHEPRTTHTAVRIIKATRRPSDAVPRDEEITRKDRDTRIEHYARIIQNGGTLFE